MAEEPMAENLDTTPSPLQAKRQISLKDFADKQWFTDLDNSTCWLRIYTLLSPKFEEFVNLLRDFPRYILIEKPCKISYVVMEDLDLSILNHFICNSNGTVKIDVRFEQNKLPLSSYVCFTTPMVIDGEKCKEIEAKRAIDHVCALMRLNLGLNLLFHQIYEGEVKMNDGQISAHGPVLKLPSNLEGPYYKSEALRAFNELVERLKRTDKLIRGRILLAMDFVQKAFKDEEVFFNCWTALEIICGKAGAIKMAIKDHYQLSNVQAVDDIFAFHKIAQWRHDFFHKGRRPILSKETEKYLLFLVLDLIRWRLNLPCAGYLHQIVTMDGLDLSPIGLANRRKSDEGRIDP
jgi:hypothetical protein